MPSASPNHYGRSALRLLNRFLGSILPANPSNPVKVMPRLKQRVLQVGATILAVSMLGGYVVYSQKSQQSGQMVPGSKARQLSPVPGQPVHTSATPVLGVLSTNPAHLMMSSSKGGVFTVSAQQPQAAGAVAQAAPVEIRVLPATNQPAAMMSSSKFVTVVRPEALQLTVLASNPPPRMIMPGSKSFIMSSPVGSSSTPASSNAPAAR
jgi:hypothetical protein